MPEPGRLALCKGNAGATIIDDTYNANPASMKAALLVLKELAEDRQAVAVLGDMLELGESSDEAHLTVGRQVAQMGVNALVTMGNGGLLIHRGAGEEGMLMQRCLHARDHEEGAKLAESLFTGDCTVLVKGSRGMQMDKVVKRLVGEDR